MNRIITPIRINKEIKDLTGDKQLVMAMAFNATFNTISVISLRSVLLVEETAVPGENHRPAASY